MASRDKVLFLVGTKKAEDKLIREFFSKFPADQQNQIAKNIFSTILEVVGTGWNPKIDGFPFLKNYNKNVKCTADIEKAQETNNYVSKPQEKAETIGANDELIVAIDDNNMDDDVIPIPTGFSKNSNKNNNGIRKFNRSK